MILMMMVMGGAWWSGAEVADVVETDGDQRNYCNLPFPSQVNSPYHDDYEGEEEEDDDCDNYYCFRFIIFKLDLIFLRS